MIVLDSSVILALLRREPEAERFVAVIDAAAKIIMSALSVFECRAVVLRRFGPGAVGELELLLRAVEADIRPFDETQATLAFEAYRRFGRGSGHAAQLNFGDCASYALATSLGLPLAFKGKDFARTDVACAQ